MKAVQAVIIHSMLSSSTEHIKKPAHQDNKKEETTLDCLAMIPRGLGTALHHQQSTLLGGTFISRYDLPWTTGQ